MKSIIGAAFAGVVLLASAAQAKETTETLKVSGWHCGGCGAKTEAKVKKVKGVKNAVADRGASTITVTFDDAEAKIADIEGAIAELNYKTEKAGAPAAAPTAPAKEEKKAN